MTTRTRKTTAKKTPAKKTTPRKTAAKPKLATVTDLRRPLPIRPIVGPPTAAHLAEGRAALAAAWCQLPIPVLAWHATPDGTAATRLHDGTHLIHAGGHNYHFTALTPCPRGAHHAHPVHDQHSLTAARITAAQCTTSHGDIDTDEAITRGIQPTPADEPPVVRSLAAAFTRTSSEDTQPTDVHALRAAHDEPKEHPHG